LSRGVEKAVNRFLRQSPNCGLAVSIVVAAFGGRLGDYLLAVTIYRLTTASVAEVDEAYIGGKSRNMHFKKQKQRGTRSSTTQRSTWRGRSTLRRHLVAVEARHQGRIRVRRARSTCSVIWTNSVSGFNNRKMTNAQRFAHTRRQSSSASADYEALFGDDLLRK